MPRPRSIFAGTTDYSGVDLEALVQELRGWRAMLAAAELTLGEARSRVDREHNRLRSPDEVAAYAAFFEDVFRDYVRDLDRVCAEIGAGVRMRHIKTLEQLHAHSQAQDQRCINFKHEHTHRPEPLPDEAMRPLLDKIYQESRQAIVDLQDLPNVTARLETFVNDGAEIASREDIVELKPNFAGLGINLNALFRWLAERFRRK